MLTEVTFIGSHELELYFSPSYIEQNRINNKDIAAQLFNE